MATVHENLSFVPIDTKVTFLNEGDFQEAGSQQLSFDVFNDKFVGRLNIFVGYSGNSTTTWKLQICKQNDSSKVREFHSTVYEKLDGKDAVVEKIKEYARKCYLSAEKKEWVELATPLKQLVSEAQLKNNLQERGILNTVCDSLKFGQTKQLLFEKIEDIKNRVGKFVKQSFGEAAKNSGRDINVAGIRTLQNSNIRISDMEAKCIEDMLFAAVSAEEVESLIDSSLQLADPVRFDMFNTNHDNFCGYLDIYFKSGGNWCFTDWRIRQGESEVYTTSLPFETVFKDKIPENPRDAIHGIMKMVKNLHDINSKSIDSWKQVDSNLDQRISPERFLKVRESNVAN